MDTQNLDKYNNILLSIKTLLENDSELCNFVRYIDYGSISNNSEEWKTNCNVLNDNNLKNQNQIVRFVKHIDVKFLDMLWKHLNHCDNNYNDSNYLDCLFVRYAARNNSSSNYSYSRSKTNLDRDIQSIMINLDCNYKIKGSSVLTALDFVCKNPKATSNEMDFYKKICMSLCRLIFVGDKCHLLALIDKNHIIYVSMKTLISIYEKDSSENKIDFNTIVLKLFKLIQRCCIYFLKCGLPQYYKEIITNDIITNIPFKDLNVDEKISLQSLDDINFDIDKNNTSNVDVKKIIEDKIENIVLKLINKKYYISNIDIPQIINNIRDNMIRMNKYNVEKAYKNGLMLNEIFVQKGWSIVDKGVRENFKNNTVGFRDGHIYIKKQVDIIPKIAYLNNNGHPQYRILKKHVIEDKVLIEKTGHRVPVNYPFIIHTLYLDITDGVLYCDGKHPNVSNGNVCMGDLRGKVVFSDANKDQINELLDSCEKLLRCINYTSSYTGQYDYVYLDDLNSRDYHGVEDEDEDETLETKNESSAKDLDFVNTNDFTEESETSETENNSEIDNGTMNVESADENDFEFDEDNNNE